MIRYENEERGSLRCSRGSRETKAASEARSQKRRARLIPLAIAVALLGPGAALAELPAAVWLATYEALPIAGGEPAQEVILSDGHSGQIRDLPLPPGFVFHFNGEAHESLHLGAKGYVTFGSQQANSGQAVNLLEADRQPHDVIAAWWGDHFCSMPAREIWTQTLGTAPNRWFVIQWHCSKNESGGTSDSRFQAQLWLLEGSEVVRARYGEISVNPRQDWSNVSWGIKVGSGAGILGPDRDGKRDVCKPAGAEGTTPKCLASLHFPAQSVIQYGLLPALDLSARPQPLDYSIRPSSIAFEVRTTLQNLSTVDASGVRYELYLADAVPFHPTAPGSRKIFSRVEGVQLPAGSAAAVIDEFSAPRPPNGRYFLCAVVDPDLALEELDRENNAVCGSERISLGPDLIGSITAPESGIAEEVVEVPIRIRNVGNADAGPFNFRIGMDPDLMEDGHAQPEDLVVQRVTGGLASGATLELSVQVRLPSIIRGDRYAFTLSLDVDREVEESDRSNNESSSQNRMLNRKPDLRFVSGTQAVHLPDGCFYGEEIEASFELCNHGSAEAWNFHPGIAMGELPHIGLLEDVSAASYPQSCLAPGTLNYNACLPIGGVEPICAYEVCRSSCESDADCESGLYCREDADLAEALGIPTAKSCMNGLGVAGGSGPPSCRSFTVRGRIPVTNRKGQPYVDGQMRFHFTDDLRSALSETSPDLFTIGPFECRQALLDVSPTQVSAPATLVAGKAFPITRRIENLGFIELPLSGAPRPEEVQVRYRYYLASTPEVSTHQIPLSVVPGDGLGAVSIGRKGSHLGMDLVELPAQLSPGLYYLGLILDPEGEHRELSKGNNTLVLPDPIRVEAAALSIVPQPPPSAILGAGYRHAFALLGATGPASWSATGLPEGLAIDEAGAIHGIPHEAGIFPITVRATVGGGTASQDFSLRVLPPQTALAVTTETLPTAVRGQPYGVWVDEIGTVHSGFRLTAAGGHPPYRWSLAASSLLPAGLQGPSEEGLIHGIATPLSQGRTITVEVEDSLGSRASRSLNLPVVGSSDLRILTELFLEGRSGAFYESCLEAEGGERSYAWSLNPATLPAGLEAEARGDLYCLVGTPTVCGNFMVEVRVEDGGGQRELRRIPLALSCGTIRSENHFLGEFRRGDAVSSPPLFTAGVEVRWRVHSGGLPPGVVIAADGSTSGAVDEGAAYGRYSVILEGRSDDGRRGLSSLSLRVAEPAREGKMVTTRTSSSGCASGGSTASTLGILVALALGLAGGRGRRAPEDAAETQGTAEGEREEPAPPRSAAEGDPEEQTMGESGAPAIDPEHPKASSLLRLLGLLSALGLILLLAWSCGDGGRVETVQDRCHGQVCGENERCDPADGLCKCGGDPSLVCGEEERCETNPTPQCVSSLCLLVRCEDGMSCDPASGSCVCGDAPCEEGERCVDGSCVEADPCAGIECGDGSSCDPEDGSCKCEGVACQEGERCEGGACVVDRCHGVYCAHSERCNPEDGRCHCGAEDGPICVGGETCARPQEEGPWTCSSLDLCAGVICPGGTSCDPADGLCRCGGVGPEAPVCAPEQSCIDGSCMGGLLCEVDGAPKVCAPGHVCDPLDGVCKCGGEVCDEGERCAFVDGAFGCATPCQLLGSPTGCGPDEGCYFAHSPAHGSEAICAPEGEMVLNGACAGAADCEAGLVCTSAGRCRRLCDLERDADLCAALYPNGICTPLPHAPPGVGYCIPG